MATAKPTPAAPAAAPDPTPVAPAAPPLPTISQAIAQRIAPKPPKPHHPRQEGPSPLDYIVVVGALALIGGGIYGLFQVNSIDKTLPIIASLLSFLAGSILGAYAGYRWGASDAMKKVAAQ